MEITINKVEPKTKKDGTLIAGEKNGRRWQIWRVNDEYDYFSGATLELEIGKTYVGKIEEVEKDGYKNKNLIIKDYVPIIKQDEYPKTETYGTGKVAPDFLQPTGTKEDNKTGEQMIIERLDKIDQRIDGIATWIKDNVKS